MPAAAQANKLWSHWQLYTVVRSLAADDESIWVGTDHGLLRFHPKSEEKTVYGAGEGLLSTVVLFVKIDPAGQAWVGTAGGGLSRLEENRWISYTPYGYGSSLTYGAAWTGWPKGQGIGDLWVYNVAFDRDGTMWAATWKGLSRFNGRAFETFTVDDGLIDQWIYTLAVDEKGRIWAGTEGGITRYDPRSGSAHTAQWKSWTNADGVGAPLQAVMPPAETDPADPLYSGGQHHTAGGPKDITRPVNPNYVSSSLFDREGRLWVGTLGGGLSRFDGRKWMSFTDKDGLSGNVVYALALDHNGRLWIGTDGGVSRYDFRRFTNFKKDDGLFAGAVYAIAVDGAGAKWFGSYGQLSRYEGD